MEQDTINELRLKQMSLWEAMSSSPFPKQRVGDVADAPSFA